MRPSRESDPAPSLNRPLRLPQRFLNRIRFDGAGAGSHVPQNLAMAASPRARGTTKSPARSAGAFTAAVPFSITGNTLSLALPVPPSINRQYATVNGRRVLSAAGRRYKQLVGQLLMAGAAPFASGWRDFLRAARDRRLALTIHFYFPTLLRRDIDGGLKITQDALCDAMTLNDNRIMELHLYKTVDRDNPRLECTLTLTTRLNPPHRTPPPARRARLA